MAFDALLWDRDLRWADFGAASDAAGVPAALDALTASTSETDAEMAYWRLDNVVVLQGSVYEAAVEILPSIVRVLVVGPEVARRWCLELLLQIAVGWTDPVEAARTSRDLAEEARAALRPLVSTLLAFTNHADRHVRETSFELVARSDRAGSASSAGHRDSGMVAVSGGVSAETAAGHGVDAVFDRSELIGGEAAEVGTLADVAADEAVAVLVGGALPG